MATTTHSVTKGFTTDTMLSLTTNINDWAKQDEIDIIGISHNVLMWDEPTQVGLKETIKRYSYSAIVTYKTRKL